MNTAGQRKLQQLADLLRTTREKRGLSQGQVAAYADVSSTYVSRLEKAEYKRPDEEKLRAIARALTLDADMIAMLGGYHVEQPEVSIRGLRIAKGYDTLTEKDKETVERVIDMVLNKERKD